MLRGILAAQGNIKAHRAAQRPALWAFDLPVLARIPLADLLAHTRIFVNALEGVFYCRENGTYPYIHWLCTLSNAIVGGLGLK